MWGLLIFQEYGISRACSRALNLALHCYENASLSLYLQETLCNFSLAKRLNPLARCVGKAKAVLRISIANTYCFLRIPFLPSISEVIFLRVTRVRELTKLSSFILIAFTCHTSQGCQIAQQVILMLIQSCQVSGINFCGSYCLWVPSLVWLLSPGSCWVLLRLLTVS